MKPHQERVVAEKAELDSKLEKLSAFMASETSKALPMSEYERLTRQQGIMERYSQVLGERITAFEP